ncbi:hypothetical protein ACYFX5_13455 [Bremerella sp. T1]|uniref:hypothetical protein n=1 Tax=Bremerella sp. TYQ1 TaxID=3119568 RepID=UPI001CCAD0DE|nr:hypothetical protein [Bremerella volcania]UBM34065.1 hypothetical protein LA756_15395 [Bremerella volcania]
MKFSITGTAANGMPVSRLMEFADEEAVREYARQQQITLSKVRPLANQHSHNVPPETYAPSSPKVTEYYKLRSRSGSCFLWGWLFVIVGIASLVFPIPLICLFIPLGLFLIMLGVIYSVGASVVNSQKEA